MAVMAVPLASKSTIYQNYQHIFLPFVRKPKSLASLEKHAHQNVRVCRKICKQ
jgi:hypothetical protein